MRNKWLLVIFILSACNSGQPEKNTHTTDSTISKDSLNKDIIKEAPVGPVAHTFWDSISSQLKLSDEQMKKHTLLGNPYASMDSFYATHYDSVEFNFKEMLGFRGDSVYRFGAFKVAILEHSGPNCLTKFLLVFDSTGTHNLSYGMIEEGCDRDGEDSPYSSQEYKILTNSTFETIETDDPGDADTTDKNITTEITRWKINNKGIIDSVRGKIIRREPKERSAD